MVEHGTVLTVGVVAPGQGVDASSQVGLVGRHPYPVLQTILATGGGRPTLDQEQAHPFFVRQPLTTGLLERPPQEHDIHGPTVRDEHFATVSRR